VLIALYDYTLPAAAVTFCKVAKDVVHILILKRKKHFCTKGKAQKVQVPKQQKRLISIQSQEIFVT